MNCPKKILLLLDYDGTLVKIVKTPNEAKISPSLKKIIRRLNKKIIVGIITGRAMADIRRQVGIKNIIYVANHGLEIKLPGKKLWVLPEARRILGQVRKNLANLQKRLKKIPAIFLENKKYSLAIHYRNARIPAKNIFSLGQEIIKNYPGLKINRGKKVMEIHPDLNWNKGQAVKKLQKIYQPRITIYLGDDRTDEEAFAVLGKKDMAIAVGKNRRTRAGYSLKNPSAVKRFLSKLLHTITE